MAAPSLRRLLLVAAVLSPAGAAVPTSSSREAAILANLGAATSCDARQRGAKGDGKADDAKHLQAALDDPRCDTVVLTANHTFLSSALHVQRSGVTLTIEGGAMLAGKNGAIKQCEAEADWRGWCSFLTVDAERDFVLNGSGTLAGGGNHGEHWSTLHVRSTVGVRLGDGLRIYCTNSWWCTVMHNASAVHATQLFIDGKTGRDGLDLVNSRDILVEDSRIEGSDDGLCFKTQADDGLGAWPARNVTVRRSYLSSECCNAIQFGSRTEVDMSEFSFEDLVIGSGRKSAIGIVSMDSANITKLRFRNITITGSQIATPLFLKLGNRAEGEDHKARTAWAVGSISDVNFTDIFAPSWGHGDASKASKLQRRPNYTPTIEGVNSSHRVGPIRLVGVHITAPGGGDVKAVSHDPPSAPDKYQPRYNGERPSWGWFVRHAHTVSFTNCTLSVAEAGTHEEHRAAVVLDDVRGVSWEGGSIAPAAAKAVSGCEVLVRGVEDDKLQTGLRTCPWDPSIASAAAAVEAVDATTGAG